MKHKAFLALLVSLFGMSMNFRAEAQTFSASSAITSDDQILNSGTAVLAFDLNDFLFSSVTTINDVVFSGAAYKYSLMVGDVFFPAFGASTSSDSAAYGAIVSFAITGQSWISVTGLETNRTYEIQLIGGLDGQAGSETLTDGTQSGVLTYDGIANSSVVETFKTTSDTEQIFFYPNDGTTVINAINLREEIAEAPEPSVLGLLAMAGVLSLAWAGGRRFVLSR